MSVLSYGWSILNRNSRQPDLMEHMMERLVINSTMAARVDGGMAFDEARTKCIFCRHETECRYWLEGSETLYGPTDFCPNVDFFRQCAEANAHDQTAAAA